LNKKAISVVGSRDASKISLNFTKNITEKFVKDGYVVVSGFARGVDRVAFESALEFGGETVCVLPQGILTFNLQRDYYKYYTQGKILICSTFEPSASWNAGFAMARNDYIYALGEKVFISESKSDGGTWNGAMSAIKHGLKNVFVRYPQEGEDNANLLLVEHGIVPVDICGNIIHIDVKSLEELIVEILSESPGLEVSKIRKKLEKNGKQMSSQKLTHILRKMNKIEYRKEKNRYVYYIKVNKQNFLFDEY
jgi:predicted Rossmann fold nucleotide-binding protein DprA/Smf involved in DNA uptake